MAQVQKGRLVKSPYKPVHRDCAMYFWIDVPVINGVIKPRNGRKYMGHWGYFTLFFVELWAKGLLRKHQIARLFQQLGERFDKVRNVS